MFARVAGSLRHSARPQCLRAVPFVIPARHIVPRRHLYDNLRQRFREDVLSTPGWSKNRTMTLVAIFFASAGVGIALWGYSSYLNFLKKTMHNYPEPVSAELRKGLYYVMYDKPQDAVRHFRAALEKCTELGMDPLSDEVTGIKIELAGILERFGLKDKTTTILEHVLDECVAGAKAQPNGLERTRLLKRGIGIGLKLGNLYQELKKPTEAEEALVWSVETILREQGRRQKDGVKVEDEGEWLGGEEIGMALENLAGYYQSNGQHFLATPLYLQALDMLPPSNCHAVVLMNNLSTSLAQQPIPKGAPITRQQLISDSATKWAQKALKVSENIKPPDRTEECDTGCAVAMYNLAEFAEMLNDRGLAKQRFEEARSLAKGLGLEEGVTRAEEGLRRLAGNDIKNTST